jgi:glutamine synthetase
MAYKSIDPNTKKLLIEKYDQLPQSSRLTLATYIWVDSTGELIRNKTRTVEFSPVKPGDLPWWDTADALSTTYVNNDIFLQPIRLFNDPFSKFEYAKGESHRNVLVLCETYKYNKTRTSELTSFEKDEYLKLRIIYYQKCLNYSILTCSKQG